MRILVSGASSGLGKFLKNTFAADAFNRELASAPQAEYDLIIHCAFNKAHTVKNTQFSSYIDDNLGLTSTLMAIPHQQFVFLSTVDVYPKDGQRYSEETPYNVSDLHMLYGLMKLQAETLLQTHARQVLILRCASLLGNDMAANTITRILAGENPKLTVAADSEYNFVRYEDVARFIQICHAQNIGGIFNLTASTNIRLDTLCTLLDKPAQFGEYRYFAGNVDNQKAAALLSSLRQTSADILQQFAQTFRQS